MNIKHLFSALLISAVLLFLATATTKADVSTNFWKLVGGNLSPANATNNLKIPSLVSCNTIDTDINGVASCGTDEGGGAGTSVALDLADNGVNESAALTEIATSGDTNSIFTEPAGDKLLIDLSKDWPNADTADALKANGANCAAGESSLGVDASGAAEGCFAVVTGTPWTGLGYLTSASINTSSELAAIMDDEDGSGTCGTGAYCVGGHTHPTTELSGVNAGTDLTADLEEEAHAAEHAVSAADTVFPADPNADRYLQWDDDPGALVWAAGAGGLASTDIDTSAELYGILTDETGSASGTPLAVFNVNPTLTGATLAGILADNDDMVFEADANNDGSNKFSFTDGASSEIASITEAGLLTVADDIVITGSDLSLGAAGVKLTGDGDGAITFLGMGDGTDENITFNLDDTSDTLVISSSTGLATIDIGTMALEIDEGKLADSTVVSADVKDNTLTAGDMADSLDFGGDTSFEIPNAAGPTVDSAGEIALDTTSDQLIYYGAAKRVVPYVQQFCKSLENPVDADDNIPIFAPRKAITITDVYCEVDGGTSVAMTLSDGTNALEAITCDADGAEDDGSIANGTFTSLERMEFDLASTSGSNTWLEICVSYVETAD